MIPCDPNSRRYFVFFRKFKSWQFSVSSLNLIAIEFPLLVPFGLLNNPIETVNFPRFVFLSVSVCRSHYYHHWMAISSIGVTAFYVSFRITRTFIYAFHISIYFLHRTLANFLVRSSFVFRQNKWSQMNRTSRTNTHRPPNQWRNCTHYSTHTHTRRPKLFKSFPSCTLQDWKMNDFLYLIYK